MYYTVVEERFEGCYVYTGLNSEIKDGLLECAIQAFPQYKNLKIIEKEGSIPEKVFIEPMF